MCRSGVSPESAPHAVVILSRAVVLAYALGSAATARAYCAYVGSNPLALIDTATNTITKTIPFGTETFGVAMASDGRTAYATTAGNSLYFVDTATNQVRGTLTLPGTTHAVAVTPDGRTAYITSGRLQSPGNTVWVVDTATETFTTITAGNNLLGIAITPDGGTAYVADPASNHIFVINTKSNSVTGSISVAGGPLGLAITPDGRSVYVADCGVPCGLGGTYSNTISVIATSSRTVSTIPLIGLHAVVAITPDGGHAFVTTVSANTVSVIETATNTVMDTFAVGVGPAAIAITPDGRTAYVADNAEPSDGGGNVWAIDTATDKVSVPIFVGTGVSGGAMVIAQFPCGQPSTCVGDCNGDGSVKVNELITMVNIALGIADVSGCLPGDVNNDGAITISEIVTAVTRALYGC